MKLAIVTELYYPSIGGQEVRFQELANQLVKHGHEVVIYTIRHDLASAKDEVVDGVRIERIVDCARYRLRLLRRNPFGIVAFTVALFRRLSELGSFDHVIFNIWPVLPVLMLASRLNRSALVDICETRSGWFWRLLYYRLTAMRDLRFLGVSPEIIRYLHTRCLVAESKCHVLVSGVDITAITPSAPGKDTKLILFFGRLTEHKNPLMLIKSFERSTLPGKGYQLVVAGGGPLLETLRDATSNSRVKILGSVSDADKWQLLERASLLVLPSRREGFPRVVAEGACVGTPTLTLDYEDNGTRHVVRDYALGFTAAQGESALIAALDDFDANRLRYTALSSNLASRAREEFGWESVTIKLERFLTLTK